MILLELQMAALFTKVVGKEQSYFYQYIVSINQRELKLLTGYEYELHLFLTIKLLIFVVRST